MIIYIIFTDEWSVSESVFILNITNFIAQFTS